MQQVRRKSLARLRREIEPVEQRTFARLTARWQGVTVRRKGLDSLLDTVENLQGTALLASELEREILPSRIANYRSGDLDTLMAAGEVVWVGIEQVGNRDGRLALYLSESLPLLLPPLELRGATATPSERAAKVVEFLAANGASFFAKVHAGLGGGFPGETRDALWGLVWSGQITNDTFHPVRDLLYQREGKNERRGSIDGTPPGSADFLRRLRSRTSGATPSQGRWSLVGERMSEPITVTQWSANIAQQLLVRYGIVLRETAIAEKIPGGYSTIYPALKTMEDGGWMRRGMFVAGLGAAQFAMPSAVDMLRSLRTEPQTPEALFLAATDPANLYGTLLPWPRDTDSPEHSMSRTSGAAVILINGSLAAFFRRRNSEVQVFLPDSEPERTQFARELARKLAEVAIRRQGRKSGLLVGSINGKPAREHFLARFLEESGFVNTSLGYQMRRVAPIALPADDAPSEDENDAEDEEATESA
jgi:ATP-dependent Lhr-like helicase